MVVEKLVAGGEGLARVDGVPLFIPLSAPGDRLRVRVVERHPDFGRASIVAILAPGPGRRAAPCPHFATCGGCDLQHLDDERQSVLRAQAALETLRRLGRLDRLPEAPLVRGRAWGYRLRTQVRTEPAGSGVAGRLLRARQSHPGADQRLSDPGARAGGHGDRPAAAARARTRRGASTSRPATSRGSPSRRRSRRCLAAR